MNTRIEKRFAQLKSENQKGFIAYICAGDPGLKHTVDIALRLEDTGVDMIELGIPFSDPLADGKVNQLAAERALNAGTTVSGVLACVAEIRKRSDIPLVLFTYLNPIFSYGFDRISRDAAKVGVDGLIALDLPVEEAEEYIRCLRSHQLDAIFLVAPTSTNERIHQVARTGSGFVYCVSREGVTGMQQKLNTSAAKLLRRTRKYTSLPIALGFGVSTPQQAREGVKHAEAVVVGSAIVDRFFQEPKTRAGRTKATAWVKTLVDAVKEN